MIHALAVLLLGAVSAWASGAVPTVVAVPVPDALVDLRTAGGAALVQAQWRVHDAAIVAVDHRGPGPDLRATGLPVRTHDVVPHADADAADWPIVAPEALETRRTNGRLAFAWYRTRVTLPDQVGDVPVRGATVVLQVVVDDYAEVWVDGRLAPVLGEAGGPLVSGFNAPTRVVLTRDAHPGQTFSLAVFGANGPLSQPPANFVWVREATLEIHRPAAPALVPTTIVRLHPDLDRLVAPGARLERVASGFRFTEGPVWLPDEHALLFSDPNANVVHRWSDDDGVSVWRTRSGYAGADVGRFGQPGSNGLAVDRHGRLVVDEHGNRRVVRIERTGAVTVLADRFEGRRLNSPNDLVLMRDGTVCFTDPPFGLPGQHDDPARELPWSGVFCLRDGVLHLVDATLRGPNGIAFSPDERWMYVTDWDPAAKTVTRFPVGDDGLPHGPGTVLADLGDVPGDEALDGLEVDVEGHLYVAGPGGIHVLAPDGRRLGRIAGPELPANFAWGDDDARTLYVTARTGLYRLRVGVAGARLPAGPAVVRRDPRLDGVIARDAAPTRVADGFVWTEGPVWRPATHELVFSDVPQNLIARWRADAGTAVLLEHAGWSGDGTFPGREPGANGLAADPRGGLIVCEHGNRRLTRLAPDGTRVVLADRYQGRRLNSPNDVVVAPDGAILFTDPPFGLPGGFDDASRELEFSGVYRLAPDGTLGLLTRALRAPNGLALSPDGRTLYVSNADPDEPVWMAFPVRDDGTLGDGRVLADARAAARVAPGLPDGMKVDARGTIFAAGPGGVWILAPDGTLLGLLDLGVATGNVALGDDALFVTAGPAVWRLPLLPAARMARR